MERKAKPTFPERDLFGKIQLWRCRARAWGFLSEGCTECGDDDDDERGFGQSLQEKGNFGFGQSKAAGLSG